MNKESNKKSIKDMVLEKIKAGKARMLPKWYFVLEAALWAAGFIIAALASFYLISFIFFILRKTGIWFLPAFGLRGIGTLLGSFPWLILVPGIVFIIILEILVRHYSFGYRKPLLYSLGAIVIFVAAAGVIVSQTSFHEGLYMRAHMGGLPIIGPLYRGYESQRIKNAHAGAIIEITSDGFKMENLQGETLTVVVTPETSFPLGLDFQEGDRVVVLGDRDDDTVDAVGVRRIDDNMRRHHFPSRGWFRPPMPMMPQ